MRILRGLVTAMLIALIPAVMAVPAAGAPAGQMTWAVHVSLAPTWFDPAETPGIITPFMFLYALHDALVKPMPGHPMAPSLAESWSVTPDGLVYEFVLRKGVRFHNGEPVTAEDVKFSFERYRGTAASSFKARVSAVEVVDPQRVRFRFKQPWPDFLTFYGTPAPRNTSRRSATTASRGPRSAPAPTNSSPSRPVWSWCSKPTSSTGARSRA